MNRYLPLKNGNYEKSTRRLYRMAENTRPDAPTNETPGHIIFQDIYYFYSYRFIFRNNQKHLMVTAKQLSFRFKVSTRLVQAKAKEIGIAKTKGRYLFDKDDVKRMAKALQNEKTKQNANVRKEDLLTQLKFIKEQLADLEYLIKQI